MKNSLRFAVTEASVFHGKKNTLLEIVNVKDH